MAPGSIFYHIFAFAIYFSFAFIFRSIKPKIQKYFAALYFICDLLFQSITNFWHHYPKGIDNPFNTSGCEVLLFVCRGCLRCVAWFSYWFDNLGFISEGNTYRRCAASSLPLWGNTDVASSDIKRNFWRRSQGGSSQDSLRPHANFWCRYPKGIDNPFNTLGCEWLLFLCRRCLHCVTWFSYWFDNLGFITEGNTYLRCATSSLLL